MRNPLANRKPSSGAERPAAVVGGSLTDALRTRVDALNRAAEAAAHGVKVDYEAHRRLSGDGAVAGAKDLVDALSERMAKLGAECVEVSSLLERYSQLADTPVAHAEKARPAAPPRQPEAVASAPTDQTGTVEVSAGIRLLATQMSTAGASREEIERRLREDFGVADSGRVISEILGD